MESHMAIFNINKEKCRYNNADNWPFRLNDEICLNVFHVLFNLSKKK